MTINVHDSGKTLTTSHGVHRKTVLDMVHYIMLVCVFICLYMCVFSRIYRVYMSLCAFLNRRGRFDDKRVMYWKSDNIIILLIIFILLLSSINHIYTEHVERDMVVQCVIRNLISHRRPFIPKGLSYTGVPEPSEKQ